MFTVARIKPANFSFTELPYDVIDKQLNVLLKDYIEIINISAQQETTMQDILKYLDLPENSTCNTYKCYESDDKIMYLLYCIDNSNPVNYIGRFLAERHEEVYGNCIVLQTINDINGTIKNCDISLHDVVDVIRSRFIHRSVLIFPNGDMQEQDFTSTPLDNTSFDENNCRCIHVEFLNKILCMFIQQQPSIDIINPYATIIGKKNKIHGAVIITLLAQPPSIEVLDLTVVLMKKILCALSDYNISRDLTNKDTCENFYVNLERRVQKMDNNINTTIPDDVLNSPPMNSTLV